MYIKVNIYIEFNQIISYNKYGENMKKKYYNKNIVNFLVTTILLIIICICISKIYFWFNDNNKNKKILKNIKEDINTNNDNNTVDSINLNELLKQNKDTVGWIKINNSVIDYPIVKYTDNSYYLTHSFDNSKNSAGWIFMDYRNNITDNNIVIYGHNRKDKSMFGSLKNILKKENYENSENKKIYFTTINGKAEYEIYSAFVINDEDIENYVKLNFKNDEEFNKFIKSTINSSYIKTNTNTDYMNKPLDFGDIEIFNETLQQLSILTFKNMQKYFDK